ncbi:phosphatidylcholine:diacylglycerol cholinephosphotransferase 1-like [Primulina huaijiensis]|uniref:phosphatidylcholine:diacylglycerol cholinephosphotransferase 1-like n=1 Tax=Primulina huaijiensis TaxID=1492673 RepID=UPI003CC7176E
MQISGNTTTATATATITARRRLFPKGKPTNGHLPCGANPQDTNNSPPIVKKRLISPPRCLFNAHFLKWSAADVRGVMRHHPVPCAFAASVLFFMFVEYTLHMVPSMAAPYDLGFAATMSLNRMLAARPALNTLLAGLNTVFVGMQTGYILWTWLIEGRTRATISTLFMFTCRGILGYVTQLPLPQEFLGSGVDFPVGNVSFFLFYSGHVAASVIASIDMKRMKRWELAYLFDTLNILQVVRLLTTRGHYTIDLAAGVGAAVLFDSLAGKYEDSAANGAFYDSPK